MKFFIQNRLFYFTIGVLICSRNFALSIPQVQDPPFQLQEQQFISTFHLASRLTDPVCSSHQFLKQLLIVEALNPQASPIGLWFRKTILYGKIFICGVFSLASSAVGIALRWAAISMQNKPFLYSKGNADEKLIDSQMSMLSWNVCCVPGGYSITDGGVLPWRYRVDKLVQAIQLQNADLVCLYEIFDVQTALKLKKDLQNDYCHFYFNIGPNILGPTSGLFIASKIEINNPEFTPFPREALDGRGKHCRKGVFSFEIVKNGKGIATIFSTHLQHSEIPNQPSKGELKARNMEMKIILDKIQKINHKSVVLTGDLNLDEFEYSNASWARYFDRGIIESCGYSWGGDKFCARLVGKKVSYPSNLDHTMALKGSGVSIRTHYVDTDFEAEKFNPYALSDHKGLFSLLTFKTQ